MPICQTVAPDNIAGASLERSLSVEVRELRKLGMDCRAASLASFLNSAKHRTIANADAPARGGKRVAA
jgi:hypothetical protein